MQWTLDVRPAPPAAPVELDEEQRRVIDHRSGPLLVLAGPGTGKTTTIVEAICARLEDPAEPLPPESVLALTFGRKAAVELRDRVAARIGGGVLPTVSTFHSFAYGLLKKTDPLEEYPESLRLMSGAEEDARIRELLVGAVVDGRLKWPEELSGALPTLGLANEVRALLVKARELGMSPERLHEIGLSSDRPAWAAIGLFAREEEEVAAFENVIDYSDLLHRAWARAVQPAWSGVLHRQYRAIYVDEYQDTDPLQVALLKALVGPAAASSRSATPTRRSTASAAPTSVGSFASRRVQDARWRAGAHRGAAPGAAVWAQHPSGGSSGVPVASPAWASRRACAGTSHARLHGARS